MTLFNDCCTRSAFSCSFNTLSSLSIRSWANLGGSTSAMLRSLGALSVLCNNKEILVVRRSVTLIHLNTTKAQIILLPSPFTQIIILIYHSRPNKGLRSLSTIFIHIYDVHELASQSLSCLPVLYSVDIGQIPSTSERIILARLGFKFTTTLFQSEVV